MRRVILLVMLTLFFIGVNVPAWSACLAAGDVVCQGPGQPQEPKGPPK